MALYPFQLFVSGYNKSDGKQISNNKIIVPLDDDSTQNVESEFLHKLKSSYTKYYYSEFEPQLPNKNNTQPIFPKFSLLFNNESYEVFFDFELLEQLFDIYIIEGWDGIIELEGVILSILQNPTQHLSGGIAEKKWPIDVFPQNEKVWKIAYHFYSYAKNILAIFIAQTLQNIEKAATERIIQKLSVTNIKTAAPWSKYDIKISKKYKKSTVSWDSPDITIEHTEYSIGDRALANDLYELLTKVVEEHHNFNLYAQRSEAFRQLKIYAQQESFKSGNDVYWREFYRQSAIKDQAEERRYKSLHEATEKLLEQLRSCILTQHPLALLIYKNLKKGFDQSFMEHLFGLTLNNLRLDLENLAKEIDPINSKASLSIPITNVINDPTGFNIFRFQVPPIGIEKYLINHFLEKYKNPQKKLQNLDLSYLPLLSVDILNQLLDEEIIEFDTFDYVVANNYLRALILKLGDIEEEDLVWGSFWKSVGKISAGLSLAALVTPVTAEFSPFLRGASAIADLALLAHTIKSINGSLKFTDDLVNKNLVGMDDFTSESYELLGEIVSIRKEFADNFDHMLAQEFFNLLIGQRLPIIKELLIARNYYYDIETLVEED